MAITPRIAVIGTGTIGSQALWQLARRGADVTGYDLAAPGHDLGAAGGGTRLFRRVEAEDLDQLEIIARADELWNELEHEAGTSLRQLTGALIIGSESATATQTAIRSAEQLNGIADVLTRGDAQARFPEFRLEADEIMIHDRGGGVIFPEKTVRVTANLAQAHGARIRENCPVQSISATGSGVAVETAHGTETYDRVVVAAGPWTSAFLPEFADCLLVRRLLSTWHPANHNSSLTNVLPFLRLAPRFAYGLPSPDGKFVKLGVGFDHHIPVDAPSRERDVFDLPDPPTADVARSLLPTVSPDPVVAHSYYEAYTPDRHELFLEHPEIKGVIVCAGFSGKGFKSAPAFGERAALMALA